MTTPNVAVRMLRRSRRCSFSSAFHRSSVRSVSRGKDWVRPLAAIGAMPTGAPGEPAAGIVGAGAIGAVIVAAAIGDALTVGSAENRVSSASGGTGAGTVFTGAKGGVLAGVVAVTGGNPPATGGITGLGGSGGRGTGPKLPASGGGAAALCGGAGGRGGTL